VPPRTFRAKLDRRDRYGGPYVEVNRSLRHEFLGKLAGWEWDVALLQETPPRWFGDLQRATGSVGARVLTSRNWLAPLSGLLAERNPDLIGSSEGGSNVLLVRTGWGAIAAAGRVRLALLPERRALVMARLALRDGSELVVANVHLSVPATGRGAGELQHAAEVATRFADGLPVVLGGDFNLRPADHGEAFDRVRDSLGLQGPTGPHAIDHLLVRGLDVVERPARLPPAAREVGGPDGRTIRLSDHAPVTAAFRLR
jgi:endonuclease/exonuclease/phosphatase family metal-dependent hydrolase